MQDIPENYFTDLSSFDELVIKANLIGYDISNPRFWNKLSKHNGTSRYVVAGGRVVFVTKRGKIYTPRLYKGHLNFRGAKLRTLEGLPSSEIVGILDVRLNHLTSLEGCTQTIKGSFFCDNNHLTSLKGGPVTVSGTFACNQNNLVSLEGGPSRAGSYTCMYNGLTSLKGAPDVVEGSFTCFNNKLETLEGGPRECKVYFDCSYNPLKSLKGAPSKVNTFQCVRTNLSRKQIDDYMKFLKNPTPDLMDETGHYCPKE